MCLHLLPIGFPCRSKNFYLRLENPLEDTPAEDGEKAVHGIQIAALHMIADTGFVSEEKQTAEENHCKLRPPSSW